MVTAAGLSSDDEIEFGWLLDWDIGCLRSAQNLIDKVGGAPDGKRLSARRGARAPHCRAAKALFLFSRRGHLSLTPFVLLPQCF
jgi:hypothetical protein